MKKIFINIILAFSLIIGNAQNEIDALRYSAHNPVGTARFISMGGAFTALGGEFTGLSLNPAGLGMYQVSEVIFTPSLKFNETKSYFNNSNISSYTSDLSVGNMGIIFAIPQNNKDWKRINIGIGWNQLNNYNQSIKIEAINYENSVVDQIISVTNGITSGELSNGVGDTYSQLAWNTYLIDPKFNNIGIIDGEYTSNFSENPKLQSKIISSSGSMNEFVFSFGSTYQEKLYVGATIGFPTLDYYEYSEYSEREISDTANNLRQMILSEEITAQGNGYNLKVGLIYRLSEKIKIGGSLHTPTFFSLEEDYNISMSTLFKDSTLNYSMGYLTPFLYDLVTPLRASIGASFIYKNLLFSGDYEMIDYSKSEYFTTDFENENLKISKIYQRAENIKIGAEYNIKPFVVRAGYAKIGNAFKNKNFERENFSYGLGINSGSYFFDLAYILSQAKNDYKLYDELDINLKNTQHNLVFTLGCRF